MVWIRGETCRCREICEALVLREFEGLSYKDIADRSGVPLLAFNFNYATLLAVAGMTFWNFCFRLFPKSISSPQLIGFLRHLKRYLRRPVLVIRARLSAHKSRMTQQWMGGAERLDSYRISAVLCAGIQPREYLWWGYWKQHELPNVCPRDYWHLDDRAPHLETHPGSTARPRRNWNQSRLPFS